MALQKELSTFRKSKQKESVKKAADSKRKVLNSFILVDYVDLLNEMILKGKKNWKNFKKKKDFLPADVE